MIDMAVWCGDHPRARTGDPSGTENGAWEATLARNRPGRPQNRVRTASLMSNAARAKNAHETAKRPKIRFLTPLTPYIDHTIRPYLSLTKAKHTKNRAKTKLDTRNPPKRVVRPSTLRVPFPNAGSAVTRGIGGKVVKN